MVTIGTSEWAELAVLLAFLVILVLASYKINSIPLRITTLIACFWFMPELYEYSLKYSITSFLLGLSVVFVTLVDSIRTGPRV